MTLFFPCGERCDEEGYEYDVGRLEYFKEILSKAGYEVKRSIIYVNCDIMWKDT